MDFQEKSEESGRIWARTQEIELERFFSKGNKELERFFKFPSQGPGN